MPCRTKPFAAPALAIGSALLLAGCESSLNIDLATNGYDSADQLVLALDGVDLLDADASKHSLDSEADAEIDALDYSGGETLPVTTEAAVSTARYIGLRLRLADSGSLLQTDSGTRYPLALDTLAFTDIDVDLAENETTDLLAMLPVQWNEFPMMKGMLQVVPLQERLPAPSVVCIRRPELPLTPAADYFCDLLRRRVLVG